MMKPDFRKGTKTDTILCNEDIILHPFLKSRVLQISNFTSENSKSGVPQIFFFSNKVVKSGVPDFRKIENLEYSGFSFFTGKVL